ncbi:MAG: flagellar filament capping protein FliD [Desulfovibrio sp.]|nr:flagellar filament capping protein FliD [Desulfovibrio sp.]
MTSSTSTTSSTTSFTSGQINVTGLGNGTDFSTLIDGLITAESATKKRFESWKQEWELKIEGLQYLNKKLLALKTTLGSIDTVNEFLTKSVTSTSDSVSATATSDALEGSHTVIVGQLAQNDILTTGSGLSTLTSVVTSNATNLTFSYAGQSYTISNIGAGSTLTSLVNYINNNSATKDKVRATTLFDGTSYHLQLYGMDQGAGNQVIVSNTGSLVFGAASFQNTQQAQSALIKVDGYPQGSGNWISRDTNSVEDVIPGVSLTLKEANSNASIKIGITTNTDAIKENVKTFVDAVNEVRTALQALTKVSNSSGTATGSIMTGNYGVQIIGTQLKDVITDLGLGFNIYNAATGTGDYYSALSQIGISTDADESSSTYGKLILNEEDLDTALSKDAEGVAKLFSADYEGGTDSANFSYLSRINGTTKAGSYGVQIITSAAGISSATINGQPAGIDGWKVTALSGDAAGMVIQVDNHTPNSTFTGNVNLRQGKAGQMVDKLKDLTNTTNGPISILEDNYGEIIDSIDDKIARETQRLTTMKARLKAQYARLDSLLNTLTNTQSQLSSVINQLSKS